MVHAHWTRGENKGGRTWLPLGVLGFSVMTAAAYAGLSEPEVTQESPSTPVGFHETRIDLPRRGVTLALRDLSGNGAQELVRIDAGGALARRLSKNGSYEVQGALLPWPGTTVGWDMADLNGAGREDLLMVADGRTATRVRFDKDTGWGQPEALFETNTYLPSGVARVPFARDIDADGRLDLVLPGPGRFHMRLNRGFSPENPQTLSWSTPVEVGYEPQIDYELGDPNRLSATFGQSVRVPWFSMFDVDGDGRQDLVSETDDRVSFHLARPEIDALPSWELDLTTLKNNVSDIDLDDLLSAVAGFAQWRIEDLDGKPPKDLIIGSQGTFKVYLGGASKGPIEKPNQVLKASGNVLYFFVRDVIGDARPDLQIVRGERISLARLVKYLVVPGKLEFDVFTYQNEGGTFAKRPTKRTTLALRVPRILSLVDDFEELSDDLEAQWDIPARRIDWDGDGKENDIVDEQGGNLVVYQDCAPPLQKFEGLSLKRGLDGFIEKVVLNDLDRLDDGGESVIDLGDLDVYAAAPGKALRDSTKGRSPAATFPLWEGEDDRAIRVKDLDGDGRLDFMTVVDGPGSTFRVQLLIRK